MILRKRRNTGTALDRFCPISPACLWLIVSVALLSGETVAARAEGLRAGAARVDITPPLPPGYMAATGKYEHERLYVRAIVVDNGTRFRCWDRA